MPESFKKNIFDFQKILRETKEDRMPGNFITLKKWQEKAKK